MPAKKEIIYPIFLECSTFADNKFWINVFQDLAYGKTPYGTYISKDFLCCNYKNKEFSYKIERKDPSKIYDEIYSLLTKKLGFLSEKERTKKIIDFHEIEKNLKNSRESWSDIRKKNVKESFIERYVIKMKHKHNLTIKKSKHLLSIIFTAMTFKIITSNDIVYSDGYIQNIYGITFANGKVKFEKSLYDTFIDKKKILCTTQSMKDLWEKYIFNLEKFLQ